MSRASRARRVATAAAFGGGGLGALSAAAVGLVYGQSKLARRRIAPAETDPPRADGLWTAPGVAGTPLELAVLGDSSAAGYGVHVATDTPGVHIALGLSALARRPVRLRSVAKVGARSADLAGQVDQVLDERPDLAVIMIGANDVTHRVRAADSVRHLSAALRTLREHNIQIVVGTCPDLGTIRPIGQPLRWLARRLSRTLAAAQAVAVVAADGRAVSLGDLLGPEFAVRHEYFSEDRFHPSAIGYARAAEVILPSAAAALGLTTTSQAAGPFTSTRARPVAKAAARAASLPGTEVAGTTVDGEATGRRGPWARLIRRRAPGVPVSVPSSTEGDPATMGAEDTAAPAAEDAAAPAATADTAAPAAEEAE